jgi:outer membrane receptor protein involved in Fe transport
MRYLKITIWIILFALISTNLQAQHPSDGFIQGSIKSKSTKKPIQFATVALFKSSDSICFTGTITDADGRYFIEHIPDGDYYLMVNLIGYSNYKSKIFSINSQINKLNLGEFSLTETSLPTENIVVTAESPTFNTAIDRKVYNIEKDLASKSGSASDLLQNVPSISVDIDGNVSLRGSEDVLILINGRSSPLMGKNRAAVLQQLPASSLERIEVITNPSAKYSPEGTSGIINLVLKKNIKSGLNGSTTVNSGWGSRFNGNINLNYKPGRFNIFGSYGMRKDNRNRYSTDERDYFNQDSLTHNYLSNTGESHGRPLSYMSSLGVDYDISERDQTGFAGNYFNRDHTQNGSSQYVSRAYDLSILGDYSRIRKSSEDESQKEATLYYEHSFAKEDHKLHAEFVYSDRPETEYNQNTEIYHISDPPDYLDSTLLKQHEKQNQFTLEYSNPLSENSKLEAGIAYESNFKNIDNLAAIFDTILQAYATDTEKTYRYKFDEAIDAIYATFEHGLGAFSFMGGLRYEYAQNKPRLITLDSTITNTYSDIYPSLHIAYQLSEGSQLQLNYSKRVNRPEADELNPFGEYHDPLNLEVGNPKLKPEHIHSVELGWQTRNDRLTVTPSIYYRYKYNGFTMVTEPYRDSILITTMKNLSHDQSAGFEFIINGSLGDYLDADINFNAFYNTIDASNIGFSNKKSVTSWSGTFNLTYKIRPTTILQTNSYYRSSRLMPQGKYLASFVSNFGARQDLFNDRFSLILTVSDLFKTRAHKAQIRTAWLNEDSKFSRDSQLVYFGVTYHFGNSAKKNEKKSLEYDNNP